MSTKTLSILQARNLVLAAQGLLETHPKPAEKTDLLSVIKRIHALQIDTINVVARAPYHILWSRLGNYNPQWLDQLHAEGELFEYWAHAACFLPIQDYPLYRRVMLDDRVGWDNIKQWGGENQEVLDLVINHIRQNGAVKSSDFERPKDKGGWWNWKVEKVALEFLFTRGDLMISRRDKFQRVYDLRERVLPVWDDQLVPSYEQALRSQVLNAIQALGVAREDWIAPYFYLPKQKVAQLLPALEAEGAIMRVAMEGVNEKAFFIHAGHQNLLHAALENQLNPTLTTLLSPFDPLINDRTRTKTLFGFDYSLECYIPAHKRIYGYFVLPILSRGKFVGRLDAKAWRKECRLEVIKLFLETETLLDDVLVNDIQQTLWSYASWQGLDVVDVMWSQPANLLERLKG